MMREEFERLTGIYPSAELYDAIEREYIESDEDKMVFCEKYKNNTDGLAEKIQQIAWKDTCEEIESNRKERADLQNKIESLQRIAEDLRQKLDKELEWRPYDFKENVSQSDYERLAHSGRELTDEEAKQLINEEFGFQIDLIRILYSVPGYEINRHGEIRRNGEHNRAPYYDATDWNYIRFDCAGWCWEMHDGALRPFKF